MSMDFFFTRIEAHSKYFHTSKLCDTAKGEREKKVNRTQGMQAISDFFWKNISVENPGERTDKRDIKNIKTTPATQTPPKNVTA